jgi:hypothetical protein
LDFPDCRIFIGLRGIHRSVLQILRRAGCSPEVNITDAQNKAAAQQVLAGSSKKKAGSIGPGPEMRQDFLIVFLFGLRLVNHKGTVHVDGIVQGVDRSPGFIFVGHFDKSKPFGAFCIAVADHKSLVDFAKIAKQFLKILVSCFPGKIAYVYVHKMIRNYPFTG